MKRPVSDTAEGGKKLTPYPADAAISFFVRLTLEPPKLDDSCVPSPPRMDVYDAIANRLIELSLKDKQINRLLAGKKNGTCLLIIVDAEKFPEDTAVISHKELERNVRDLVLNLYPDPFISQAYGPLLTAAKDLQHGQIFATVAMFATLDAARKYCVKLQSGEIRLRPRGKHELLLNRLQQKTNEILIADWPDFESGRRSLAHLSDALRLEIATAFAPMLNEQAHNQEKHPQSTYEDKKSLSKWINAELRRFSLALKSDRTEIPCLLMANPGGRPGIGRFVVYYTDNDGKRHDVLSSAELPKLELIPDDLNRVPYGQRTGRAL